MAKSTASRSSGPDPAPLLEGLRKALSGPQPLLGKDALFPSTAKGKELARVAVEEGYLASRTESQPPAGKRGKAKEVVVAELTAKGRQHVLETDSPKRVLEALLPAVQALSAGPPAPADTSRPELDEATRACVRAIEEGFARLHKIVEAALARMEQAVVESRPTGPRPDPGPILAALREALARVTAPPVPAAPAARPPTPAPLPTPVPAPTPHAPPPAEPLSADRVRAALRAAYDELCLYAEFRDKLVEIPRLYHEAVRRLPGLSVERFHRELEALSSERKVELHKLNEVHLAKERGLAIEKDDRLYYYLYWR